jgi:hypothetical protein
MNQSVPAHKQLDLAKRPGQIVNHDMMDDMAAFAESKLYKPTHGGYPTPAPIAAGTPVIYVDSKGTARPTL